MEGRDEGRYEGAKDVRGAETTGMGGMDMGMPGGVEFRGSGWVGIIMGVSVGGPATTLGMLGGGPSGPGWLVLKGGRGEPMFMFMFMGEPGFMFMGEPGCMGELGDLGMGF